MAMPDPPRPAATASYVLTRVREIRRERGLTTRRAAKVAGMSETYWSYLERYTTYGKSPTLATLEKMMIPLGVRMELVRGTSSRPEPVPPSEPTPREEARLRGANPTVRRLAARLRATRVTLLLTQTQAAVRAGWQKGTWGHLERGYVSSRDIGVERMQAAGSALGMSLDYVAEHHAPFLELDADEVARVRGLIRWYRDNGPGSAQFDSIAAKLELDAPATLDKAA